MTSGRDGTCGLVACTIAAHNYLPLVRVLAKSFLEHHPDARFAVALIDHPLAARSLTDECFDVIPITDIDFDGDGFEHMATAYDVTEFATSVKPFLLRHLLREADCVLYLDPDICVYAPLDPLIAATRDEGWSLTPHCVHPMSRNGTYPVETEIMAAGIHNLGFIGVTEKATSFLEWWSERLRHHALIDPTNQLFTDQRWIDLAVPIFSPYIERSPAYNLAYWNIDQRPLTRLGHVVMVGDEPLRFFHFSGYDRTTPWWLTKYQPHKPRALLSEHPLVAELCVDHSERIAAESDPADDMLPYGWAEAFPGLVLDRSLRRMFHEALVTAVIEGEAPPPSPFVAGGAMRFRAWLSDVDPKAPTGLPRFLATLWATRLDLRAAFAEVANGTTDKFWEWVQTSGRSEVPAIDLLEIHPPKAAVPIVEDRVDRATRDGVDIVGYFSAELGTGEAGRLLALGLGTTDLEVSTISCAADATRQQHPFRTRDTGRHQTVIMSINADQLGSVRHRLGARFFDDTYVIGQWFWEVEAFPKVYTGAFQLVHEVWVATEHIRRALERHEPAQTVTLMPLPLVQPVCAQGVGKLDFGLPDDFTFLFAFDFLSVFERKNPIGVIDAFREAFAPGEGPVLMIKTINGARRLQELERLRWAARGRRDIVIFDGHLDVDMMGALMAASDCYVSLHRAEGLGLTMAEAMALGKPVIATAYSGNMDFMTPETAHLVPWTPALIGEDCAPYPAEGMWAEPDLGVAAEMMRRAAGDPEAAKQVGVAAQADLINRFSPTVTGRRMEARLAAVSRWGADA